MRIEFTGFTEHLPLKVLDFFQVKSFACSVLGNLQVLIESWHTFCHASNFPSKMFDKLVLGRIWLCAPCFESVVHGEICV